MRSNWRSIMRLFRTASVPGDILQARARPPVPFRSAASWPASPCPACSCIPPSRRPSRKSCTSWCRSRRRPAARPSRSTLRGRVVHASRRAHPSHPSAGPASRHSSMSSVLSVRGRSRRTFQAPRSLLVGARQKSGTRTALQHRRRPCSDTRVITPAFLSKRSEKSCR